MLLVILPAVSQVKSKIQTRTGYKNQLEIYGRVAYHGLLYFPTGKDSLLVQNDAKMDSVVIPPVLTIDNKPYIVAGFKDNAFEYDVDLKYISIPTSITEIASSCFYGCSRLRECEMPSVEIIDSYAFCRTGLTHIEFPQHLKHIGAFAFRECDELKYVEFPAEIQSIGKSAFASCHIDTIKVNSITPFELIGPVFETRSSQFKQPYTVLSVPKGSKELYEQSDGWRRFKIIVEH